MADSVVCLLVVGYWEAGPRFAEVGRAVCRVLNTYPANGSPGQGQGGVPATEKHGQMCMPCASTLAAAATNPRHPLLDPPAAAHASQPRSPPPCRCSPPDLHPQAQKNRNEVNLLAPHLGKHGAAPPKVARGQAWSRGCVNSRSTGFPDRGRKPDRGGLLLTHLAVDCTWHQLLAASTHHCLHRSHRTPHQQPPYTTRCQSIPSLG